MATSKHTGPITSPQKNLNHVYFTGCTARMSVLIANGKHNTVSVIKLSPNSATCFKSGRQIMSRHRLRYQQTWSEFTYNEHTCCQLKNKSCKRCTFAADVEVHCKPALERSAVQRHNGNSLVNLSLIKLMDVRFGPEFITNIQTVTSGSWCLLVFFVSPQNEMAFDDPRRVR